MTFTTFPCVTRRFTGKLSATVVSELNTASNGVRAAPVGVGVTTRIRPCSVMSGRTNGTGGSHQPGGDDQPLLLGIRRPAPGCWTVGRATIAVTTSSRMTSSGCSTYGGSDEG